MRTGAGVTMTVDKLTQGKRWQRCQWWRKQNRFSIWVLKYLSNWDFRDWCEVLLEIETNRDVRQKRSIASHRIENWISPSEQKRSAACCPQKLRNINILSVIDVKHVMKGSLNTFLGCGRGTLLCSVHHDEPFHHLCTEEMRAAAFHLQRCIAVQWVRRAHSNGLIYLSLARGRGVAAPVALSLTRCTQYDEDGTCTVGQYQNSGTC